MTTVRPGSDPGPVRQPGEAGALDALIRVDQLAGIRRSLKIALPVNVLLSVAIYAVAVRHGQGTLGAIWFTAATIVSVLRLGQSRLRWPRSARGSVSATDRQLAAAAALACLSGLVWACTPLLAHGAGGADAVFYLIVGAGITGGSIAMGFAYAPVALLFVTPILVSHAAFLARSGSAENAFLAVTVVIYLVALCRSALLGQQSFRATAWLKHEATTLAKSLREAHAQTSAVAEEMSHRARHDSLTGLLNRAGFMGELECRHAADPAACGLMLLDLDGFKSINDTFGHKVGDRVLIEVARRIGAILPADAAVSRLGGDEFAVVFDPRLSQTSPGEMAESLIGAVGARFETFDAGRLGVSIGIYDGPWPETAEVLVYADEALYAAKSAGRNRHAFFDEALRRRLEMRRDSERDLLAALEGGTLQVWYQPIFGDGGRRLTGIEALLRWRHPKHGPISPVDIIAAAALAGHAERVLGFVADEACRMAGSLRSLGQARVSVSINVSPREMSQLAVDALVLGRLEAHGLPGEALAIEITEDTALDIRAVQGKLAALSAAGIRIAVDDFGVGYSSLATLRHLHADCIKIDRCFVTGLATSPDNRMLLQAVVSLGRAMQLDVVAEGVETAQDVVILRALGCQFMQGYHLGKPMTAEAMLQIVAGRDKPKAAATAA